MHFGGPTLPVGFTIGFPVRNPVVFEVVFLVDFPVVFPVIHKHSECPIHLIAKKLIIQTICNIFANLNQKVYPSVLPTNQNRYDGPKVPKRNKQSSNQPGWRNR
jgi:hypothetical protein